MFAGVKAKRGIYRRKKKIRGKKRPRMPRGRIFRILRTDRKSRRRDVCVTEDWRGWTCADFLNGNGLPAILHFLRHPIAPAAAHDNRTLSCTFIRQPILRRVGTNYNYYHSGHQPKNSLKSIATSYTMY